MATGGLGKGLGSLIPVKKITPQETSEMVVKNLEMKISGGKEEKILDLSVDAIKPNPWQPRKVFKDEELNELVISIKQFGVLTPIIVTRKDGDYELVAGERRLRASKMAGLKTVPAIVRDFKAQQKLEVALIENIVRKNLDPLEESWAYKKLMDEFNLTHEEMASRLGKSRSQISNMLRLLTLPLEIQKALVEGEITFGHAKLILSLEDESKQLSLFKQIIGNNLSVRDSEIKVKNVKIGRKDNLILDPYLDSFRKILQDKLQTKVEIVSKGRKGKLVIDFYSKDNLRELINKILAEN